MRQINDLLSSFLRSSNLAPPSQPEMDLLELLNQNDFKRAFRLMNIAEREIAFAIEEHPSKKAIINDVFSSLCPSKLLNDVSEDFYALHCRELIERAMMGGQMEEATDVEMLAFMSNLTLQAPLISRAKGFYTRLFKKVAPDMLDLPDPWEEWDGAFEEFESEVRMKIRGLKLRLR